MGKPGIDFPALRVRSRPAPLQNPTHGLASSITSVAHHGQESVSIICLLQLGRVADPAGGLRRRSRGRGPGHILKVEELRHIHLRGIALGQG